MDAAVVPYGAPSICSDDAGNVWLAYSQMSVDISSVAKKYNGNSWQTVGSGINGAKDAKICCWNGNIYLACITNRSAFTVYKLINGAWNAQFLDNTYPQDTSLFTDANGVYVSYVKDGKTLVIRTVENSAGQKMR